MADSVEGLEAPRPAAVPRRRWSEADERRIIAESYRLGISVARRNAVNADLVFK